MAKIANVQIASWLDPSECLVGDVSVTIGDFVIIETETSKEIGQVIGLFDVSSTDAVARVVRSATSDDLAELRQMQAGREGALQYCRAAVSRLNLAMKVIDAHYTFDGSRLVFPFIADSRVDFRDLVKELSHHFKKIIRLQQIGIRDEAKLFGDVGPCGLGLCCRQFLSELGNVTSDLAEMQQVSHRGSDRLTGPCGRLRCCLAFEKGNYPTGNTSPRSGMRSADAPRHTARGPKT